MQRIASAFVCSVCCTDRTGLYDCRWARKLLLLEFAFYVVWLLAFQVFMLLFQVSPCQSICCSALPCPALPCPALPCPALPCPALPCPACPALQHDALPCLTLACPSLVLLWNLSCRVVCLCPSCLSWACPPKLFLCASQCANASASFAQYMLKMMTNADLLDFSAH